MNSNTRSEKLRKQINKAKAKVNSIITKHRSYQRIKKYPSSHTQDRMEYFIQSNTNCHAQMYNTSSAITGITCALTSQNLSHT